MALTENRILIIEGHPMVAQAIATRLLEHDPSLNFTVCDCVASAVEELHKADSWFRIFIDLNVPDGRGLFLVRLCQKMGAIQRCVVISETDNVCWIAEIKGMGALGFIKKSSGLQDFTRALALVLDGTRVFQESFSDSRSIPVLSSSLTRRQQDVLCLLQRGYTSKRIASQLGLRPGTVDNHVMGLVRALCATGRTHAVAKAIEFGYLKA